MVLHIIRMDLETHSQKKEEKNENKNHTNTNNNFSRFKRFYRCKSSILIFKENQPRERDNKIIKHLILTIFFFINNNENNENLI